MTTVEHECDEQSLVNQFLKQESKFDVAQVSSLIIAEVGGNQCLVNVLVRNQLAVFGQGFHATAVAGIVYVDLFAGLCVFSNLVKSLQDVGVGRPLLGRLGWLLILQQRRLLSGPSRRRIICAAS